MRYRTSVIDGKNYQQLLLSFHMSKINYYKKISIFHFCERISHATIIAYSNILNIAAEIVKQTVYVL